jgi:predicted Zn-dependent protease with MMP-like domain
VFVMKREEFSKAVGEALDSLPAEFRRKIRNVAVLVEDLPPNPIPSEPGQPRRILLGLFHGIPMTQKSVFQGPIGSPDYVVLYQKNIEAVCSSEAAVREQIRRTVVHEMGHYFGMTEEQVRHMESAGEVGGPMRK